VILRRLHLACFFVLIGMGAAPLFGASSASVSGVVRDSAGVPQIGAIVELLRPDLSVAARVYTNSKGRFAFSTAPGRYAVKAMGASFLPSLRENVRVRTNTVVNLTLNTLYDVIQWLPAEPRGRGAQKDDWAWTLRSAANRPLLRWLEDGPLVMVSEGRNSTQKLKARLVATGQQGTFGEDGQRISMEVEDTPSDSRELLARVDFDPGSDAGVESTLGFRQDLGFAGSVQSVAAVAIHPEVNAGEAEGLIEAAMRTWESMNLGDTVQVDAGTEQVVSRFAQGGPGTVMAALPFVTVGWRAEDSTVRYRMATAIPEMAEQDDSQAGAWLPAMSVRNGNLVVERGMHQEIGWDRKTDASQIAVLVYSDSLHNPVLEASGRFAAANVAFQQHVLYDGRSGLLRMAGAGYSSAGMVAAVERRLPGGDSVRVTYANGDALVMAASQRPLMLSQLVAMARPRHAQMYSISVSGTIEGTRTRWRASYRWQPEDTVTRIAPYAEDAGEPYFNLYVRQPVCVRHEGGRSIDAMIDMRNVLGQGQQPFVLTDGTLLMFAQDQRSMSAGLAFTF
jgi:hypothetical protein